MRAISTMLFGLGLLIAAVAEGLCVGALLSLAMMWLFFPDSDFIGIGLFFLLVIGFCVLVCGLFGYVFLWDRARPDLP
jgi:hypothetical protein